LQGYERIKPFGLSNATICPGQSGSVVRGFIIFGFSEEALRCLDHLLSEEELKKLFNDRNISTPVIQRKFSRRLVKVIISVQGGDAMTIDSVTYGSTSARSALEQPWDINKFVRSDAFTKLSGAVQGSFWMEEEARLASTMGMTLVLSAQWHCWIPFFRTIAGG
jgi:hypothetical protein